MSTNGTLLDEAKIHAIIESGIDEIKISLWSSSTEGYERQYPNANPDNFDKVTNAVKLFSAIRKKQHKTRPVLFLHQPINRHNFHKIDEFTDLAIATGCDGVSFSPFLSIQGRFDTYSLSREEEIAVCSHLQKMRTRLESQVLKNNINRVLWRYRVGRQMGTRHTCYIGWFHSRMRVDGTISPCGHCNIVLGNLNDMSFKRIWNGASYRDFRKRSLSPEGHASLKDQCDCQFCCYTEDNIRVHRFARWILPLIEKQCR
jgi:MoaA/NifB/PqqE/SkfB family radical SAM enzyme